MSEAHICVASSTVQSVQHWQHLCCTHLAKLTLVSTVQLQTICQCHNEAISSTTPSNIEHQT